MNNLLTINLRAAKRMVCLMLAVLLFVAASPLFPVNKASAAQVANRSIKISDAAASGTSITTGVGSGTNVTYRVSFDATVAAESLIVEFCQETPLMNGPCTRPTGMDTTATAFASVTGNLGTGWTLTNSTNGALKLANDANSAHDIASGTQSFDITGVTNPSTVGTFYARIYTFTNNTWGSYAGPTAAGNFVDFGGIALSTVNVITITARVQEQLTFCVTKADPAGWNTTHDCSDPVVGSSGNLPAVVLGHVQNGIQVLDSGAVDTGTIYSQLSTNATNGAVIRLRNSNLTCGGLSADNGTTCAIPAHNAGSGAGASIMNAGTAAFGLFVADSTLGTNGIGALTPAAAYHNASHVTVPTDVWYGMDTTTANNNTTSTFGSTLSDTSSPIYRINTAYTFAATAALTTPAGIYTANLSMIATGTF
jgi:hypothetical protein